VTKVESCNSVDIDNSIQSAGFVSEQRRATKRVAVRWRQERAINQSSAHTPAQYLHDALASRG
jgi:hypothetical protein